MTHSKTLVIFDIDGTLLFSNKVDSQLFSIAFYNQFGFELPTLDWSLYPHCTDTSILDTLFKNEGKQVPSNSKMEIFKNEYVALLEQERVKRPEEFKVVPGARQLIEYLVANPKFIVGIGTGGFRKPAMVKLKHVGINTNRLFMAFSDGNISREDIIEEVLQKVGTKQVVPEHIVYIGDAIWDVQTTCNMNIPFIGIRHKEDKDILMDAGASHVVSNYLDQKYFLELIEIATVPKSSF